jgi:murein DD-endopeptidase MepM/ murein hydrolase activator NlpD
VRVRAPLTALAAVMWGSCAFAAEAPAVAAPSAPAEPSFGPPGAAHAAGGKAFTDATVFVPGMRFPVGEAKAFANSQVYGHGGSNGPGGGQCDAANYAYPWQDNFCEARAYKTPMCPAGNGHQGQDIRPNSCSKARFMAVATEAGEVTHVGTYTVYVTAEDGRIFRYLHLQMDQLKVKLGDKVQRGQAIGLVSNNFGKTPTTIHLHFEIKQPITRDGKSLLTWVPPYTSLVDSYQRLLAGAP